MTSLLGRLAPGSSAKVNLLMDLALLLAAIAVSTWLSNTGIDLTAHLAPWFAALACLVWVVTSTALRHYDPWANREPMDDAALVSVLVMAVATALALCQLA